MSGVISALGGWWARLQGRGDASRPDGSTSTLLAESGSLTPVKPGGRTPAERDSGQAGGMILAEVEESFVETVQLRARPVVTRGPFQPDPMIRERTLEVLGSLRQIPALESLARGFVQAVGRTEVSVEEIVEAIEKDAALCVRVLRMANSVFVSPEQRIEDLDTAVQMLGVLRVRMAAQALLTLRDAQQMVAGFDWRNLWIHAFATAAIAEELERRIRPVANSQIYLAALLHDVGKVVLSTVAPEDYRGLLVEAWKGERRLEELERERLGVDHREAGVMFASQNQLSDLVMEVIAHHAKPEGACGFRAEVALVSIANYLSKAQQLGFSGARLDPTDGGLAELSAWGVLESECGLRLDPAFIEESMLDFVQVLRPELRGLREGT